MPRGDAEYDTFGFSTMTFDVVIRNGTIVTATDSYRADIGIQAGKIAQIGGPIAPTRR